jgi:FkbM family methyltransferase
MPLVAPTVDEDFLHSRQKAAVHSMIRQHLTQGQTGVDVGAAVGELSATMRACVGRDGTVIAIEPRDTQIDDATVVHRVACGRHATSQALYLADTGSSLHRHAAGPDVAHAPLVAVRRLDDLVTQADLVKLDVQGAEVDVLLGAPALLAQCPVWVLEVWPFGLQCAGASLEQLWTLLSANALVPYDVYGAEITGARLCRWLMRLRSPAKHTNWVCVRG